MSNFLLCSTPVYGHVAPMITVGRHLVGSGHRVRMLTGSRFADAVTAAGMEHVSLPAGADYDDRDVAAAFPGRDRKRGIGKLQFDIENVFVSVIPHQYRGLREQLDLAAAQGQPIDAVLAETGFTGIDPLLLERDGDRPPVLVCGVLPLTVSSRDAAPFGLGLPPLTTRLGRLRNRGLNFLVSKVIFGRAQRMAQAQLRELGARPLPCFVLDGTILAEKTLQLTASGFEYPRSDLRSPVDFVGAVLPALGSFEPPSWWSDVDGSRPVVHVTQGTIANDDLDALMLPTIRALADRDLLVVATTGDEKTAARLREQVPANVRVAAFLPYDQLLGKVDVMVTNGGYGGVQFALANGVPLVVAGDTEDKPEIAARVAWSGAGINLRTGAPSSLAIGDAVDRILNEPGYRAAANRLRDELAACTPLETIERELAAAAARAAHPSAAARG